MKQILFIIVTVLIFIGCDSNSRTHQNNNKIYSDTLKIGSGLKLKKPFVVEYDVNKSGTMEQGRICIGEKTLYTFRLNFNIADTIKLNQCVFTDTVSTSFRRDTLIFNWYKEGELNWLTVKSLTTHSAVPSDTYLIYGYSKPEQPDIDELKYLFSEIRRVTLANFFDYDSVLMKKIIN